MKLPYNPVIPPFERSAPLVMYDTRLAAEIDINPLHLEDHFAGLGLNRAARNRTRVVVLPDGEDDIYETIRRWGRFGDDDIALYVGYDMNRSLPDDERQEEEAKLTSVISAELAYECKRRADTARMGREALVDEELRETLRYADVAYRRRVVPAVIGAVALNIFGCAAGNLVADQFPQPVLAAGIIWGLGIGVGIAGVAWQSKRVSRAIWSSTFRRTSPTERRAMEHSLRHQWALATKQVPPLAKVRLRPQAP